MAVQTAYSTTHGFAYAGMLADLQTGNIASRLNNTAAVIPYGKGVVTGDVAGAMALPATGATANEVVGVVMYEINRAQKDTDVAGATINQDASIITDGVVYVNLLDTVLADAPVYLRLGATDTGDFSGIAGTGVTEGLLIPTAKFLDAGDAGDLVRIKLTIGG